MLNTAVRLHGKADIRLDRFDLPEPGENEILAEVISDSACMSTYKAVMQGENHKRVPADIAENPVIIGHEFCGRILTVGSKWQDRFASGDCFSIQPAMNYKGSLAAPGYSYRFIGGDSQYVIIPNEVMETDCLLKFDGPAFYLGSLAEPLSCVIGAYHASYHMAPGSYEHKMGIKAGGRMAILGGTGPMGLCAVEYALHGPRHPSVLLVTDIDESKLARAASIYSPEAAAKLGIRLIYANTSLSEYSAAGLFEICGGFDDVFCMAPVKSAAEQADALLARDGCLNFFAGPADPGFSAQFNFYKAHYNGTHICATSGGNNDDLREALKLMSEGAVDPSSMISHIGGIGAVCETVMKLPSIPGGKKLIYTHKDFPLISLPELEKSPDPVLAETGRIVAANGGRWCPDAEKYLLDNMKDYT